MAPSTVAPYSGDPIVTLSAGLVTGKTLGNGCRQWLGVPYASPPTEPRTAAFEAPAPLKIIRPEMQAGAREMDRPYGGGMPELSLLFCPRCTCCVYCSWCLRERNEDTDGDPKKAGLDVLRMNIWSPSRAAQGPVPVVVWIHGGGDAGSARTDDPNSRPGDKLAEAEGLVVCCLEFRQGIFGTMDWGPGSDVPSNIELRDMLCGLRWIQDNIRAFGGDPSCVTICGESIGGRRVCELVWCPAASGLFHRAIAVSPSNWEVCNAAKEHRDFRRSLVNRYLGLPPDAAPSAQQLSRLPRAKLANAQHAAKGSLKFLPRTRWSGAPEEDAKLFGGTAQVARTPAELAAVGLGFLNWRTVEGKRTGFFDACFLDGDLLPDPVGSGPPGVCVPLLLMLTKDEYSPFALMPGLKPSDVTSRPQAVQRLQELMPFRGVIAASAREEIAGAYLDRYAKDVLPAGAPLSDAYTAAMQDLWQYHPVRAAASTHSAALPGQTFVAELVYDTGNGTTPHGTDVSLAFGYMPGIPVHGKGADLEGVTATVQGVYSSFARTGDPSTGAAPFAAFAAEKPRMTLIDSERRGGGGCRVVDGGKPEREAAYAEMVSAIRRAEEL